MFLQGVQVVCSVFLIVGLGMLLAHLKWLDKAAMDLLSRLVVQVGLPCMTVAQLFSQYDQRALLGALPYLGMAFLSVGLMYALAFAAQALLRVPTPKRGVFRCLFAFGNTIFIGLPITTALFGEAALPPTLMYYLANTTLFWTLGVSGVQVDGGAPRAGFRLAALRRVLTMPLITFTACTALILAGFSLPKLLLDTARYVGNMVTPLSLFFIGAILHRMLREGLVWQRGYAGLLAARFLLSPLLMMTIGAALGGLPTLWRSAFLLQAGMPAQSSTAIVAHNYGGDEEYATGGITLTTLLSACVIPLFAALAASLG
ncbi:MAG: AEC family transporter [Oscillospiraceae bacterium]|nr:AEC family transporter [Oscillospiraceae bacterium]